MARLIQSQAIASTPLDWTIGPASTGSNPRFDASFMERDGILCRTVYPVVPPHTEYELSSLGLSLVPPLQSICRWGQENYSKVESHRVAHDELRSHQDPANAPDPDS